MPVADLNKQSLKVGDKCKVKGITVDGIIAAKGECNIVTQYMKYHKLTGSKSEVNKLEDSSVMKKWTPPFLTLKPTAV